MTENSLCDNVQFTCGKYLYCDFTGAFGICKRCTAVPSIEKCKSLEFQAAADQCSECCFLNDEINNKTDDKNQETTSTMTTAIQTTVSPKRIEVKFIGAQAAQAEGHTPKISLIDCSGEILETYHSFFLNQGASDRKVWITDFPFDSDNHHFLFQNVGTNDVLLEYVTIYICEEESCTPHKTWQNLFWFTENCAAETLYTGQKCSDGCRCFVEEVFSIKSEKMVLGRYSSVCF